MNLKKLIPNYKGISIFSKRYWKMWYQRRKYGFDESETWSLDYSLSKTIAPRLRMFIKIAKNNGSLPSWLLLDEQKQSLARGFKWNARWGRIDNKKEEQNCWDRAQKRWGEILDKMQEAFDDIILEEDDWDAWNQKWLQRDKNHCENEKLAYSMRQEGLELFAKHFQSLWW